MRTSTMHHLAGAADETAAYDAAVDHLASLTCAWGRSGADCEYAREDVREILAALRSDPHLAETALRGTDG